MMAHELQNRQAFLSCIQSTPYVEREVGTIERRQKYFGIRNLQLLQNVCSRDLVRRGCQCHDRYVRMSFMKDAQTGVFGAEIMAPSGDTVSFVNSEE